MACATPRVELDDDPWESGWEPAPSDRPTQLCSRCPAIRIAPIAALFTGVSFRIEVETFVQALRTLQVVERDALQGTSYRHFVQECTSYNHFVQALGLF